MVLSTAYHEDSNASTFGDADKSSKAPAPLATRTIDCAVLQTLHSLADTSNPSSNTVVIRIPLLPDTLAAYSPEAAGPPIRAVPEILVVAPHPPNDTARTPPSAVTEVTCIGVDGVELRFMHKPKPKAPPEMVKSWFLSTIL